MRQESRKLSISIQRIRVSEVGGKGSRLGPCLWLWVWWAVGGRVCCGGVLCWRAQRTEAKFGRLCKTVNVTDQNLAQNGKSRLLAGSV